ncbi:MAG: hypothetical protein ACYCT9_02650 [Leptospirillum sp.]
MLWRWFLLRVSVRVGSTTSNFSMRRFFTSFAWGLLLLSGCHLSTESPIQIEPQNVQIISKNGITFILVPLGVIDKGSRTLRVHLRHSILDLTTNDKRNYRLRGSDTSDFVLHHSDKKYADIYPSIWKESWVDRVMAHKDAVVPAENQKFIPMLYLYRGTLTGLDHMTLHLVYSYPQTASNDEIILDLPQSPK